MPDHQLKNTVRQFIEKLAVHGPPPIKVILGLSGGPDSVFLFHELVACHRAGIFSLTAAHLDHGWRATSAQDAQFCKKLCAEHGIPYVQAHANDFKDSVTPQGSKEEHGRNLRRFFFEKLLVEHQANYIALAHHQQDQEETFFLRLIRGSSLQGLTGIRPIEGPYIRPLLTISKTDIVAFLDTHKLSYCLDPSNDSPDYLRNRIRHAVIPALEQADPRFRAKFHDTLKNLQNEEAFLTALTQDVSQTVFKSGETKGNLKFFFNFDPVIQKRLLIQWLSANKVPFTPSTGFLDEILRFLHSPRGGTHDIAPGVKLCKKSNMMWLFISEEEKV